MSVIRLTVLDSPLALYWTTKASRMRYALSNEIWRLNLESFKVVRMNGALCRLRVFTACPSVSQSESVYCSEKNARTAQTWICDA